MKAFIKKVAVFVAVIIFLDFCSGYLFSFLETNAKGGSTKQDYYIAEECDKEIIVLGSSRASHHYVPSVFESKLGLSCYNCGKDGMGSVLSCARFEMLIERYTPKVIIYEITPGFDYGKEDDYSVYFSHLKPFYDKKGVKKIIDKFSQPENKLQMFSKMYRYNSRIIPDIVDNLTVRYDMGDGYLPLYGTMKKEKSPQKQSDNFELDNTKYELIKDLVKECENKNIKLIFAVSPKYDGKITDEYNPAIELAEQYNIPFINHLEFDGITKNMNMFQDGTHMNDTGAKIYSEFVAKEIKEFL